MVFVAGGAAGEMGAHAGKGHRDEDRALVGAEAALDLLAEGRDQVTGLGLVRDATPRVGEDRPGLVLERDLASLPGAAADLDPRLEQGELVGPGGEAAFAAKLGLDKFFNVLVDWEIYLAPWINDIVPGSASTAMHLVGAIEIVAGLAVALKPRYGAYLVAAWLAGIIINLLTYSGYYDIALRDFGLMLGALTLARLASKYDPPGSEVRL